MGKRINILKILIHVLAWVGIFLLLDLSIPAALSDIPFEFHIKVFITILVALCLFYLNTHILIPKLLFKRKIGAYVLVLIGVVLLSYQINCYTSTFLDFEKVIYQIEEEIYFEELNEEYEDSEEVEDIPTLLVMFALVFGVISSYAIQHYKYEKQQEKIERDRKEAELAFLKNQVNPHFFFNTLNNIYALIAIDSQKARKTVLQLSQMMRYVLYESDQDRVSLKQEFDFISEYIGLMKLRLNDTEVVNLDLDKTIDLNKMIPPLLFIPFIENAFKHGGGPDSEIHIKVAQELNEIVLKVANKITNNDHEIGGVGLSNVKKRLELLFPLNTYSLEVKSKDQWFMVELRIII